MKTLPTIADWTTHLLTHPTDASAYRARGRLYFEQKSYDEANKDFQIVIQLLEGIRVEGIRALTDAEERCLIRAYGDHGWVYIEQKKWNEASVFYEKAISLLEARGGKQLPTDAEQDRLKWLIKLYQNCHFVYRQQKEWDKASRCNEKIMSLLVEQPLLVTIKKNPKDTRAYHALAKHYVNQRMWIEAVQAYKTRLDLPEQDAKVAINELTKAHQLLKILKRAVPEPLSYHDVEELLIKVCIKREALYYQQQESGYADIAFAEDLEKKPALTDTERVLLAAAYRVRANRCIENSAKDKNWLLNKANSEYTVAIDSLAKCSQLSDHTKALLQDCHDRRLAALNQQIENLKQAVPLEKYFKRGMCHLEQLRSIRQGLSNKNLDSIRQELRDKANAANQDFTRVIDQSSTREVKLYIQAHFERGKLYLEQCEWDEQNSEEWGTKAIKDLRRAKFLVESEKENLIEENLRWEILQNLDYGEKIQQLKEQSAQQKTQQSTGQSSSSSMASQIMAHTEVFSQPTASNTSQSGASSSTTKPSEQQSSRGLGAGK